MWTAGERIGTTSQQGELWSPLMRRTQNIGQTQSQRAGAQLLTQNLQRFP
jgi:hypothetical protein